VTASVDSRLDADGSAIWDCGNGQLVGAQFFASNTATVVPDVNGHALGSLSLGVQAFPSGCTQLVLQRIDYTNVILTNLTTGHVYRLDPISQTFP
jgi:hypothetical protein